MDIFALSDLSTPWCVHVVATLRTADHMAAGITQIDELAAASGCNADALYRVLTRLVGKGVFEEPTTFSRIYERAVEIKGVKTYLE